MRTENPRAGSSILSLATFSVAYAFFRSGQPELVAVLFAPRPF